MRILLSALLLALTVAMVGVPAAPAAAGCDIDVESCSSLFTALRGNISTYAPSGGIRTSMLQRATLAEQSFPNDPVRAASILGGVACETRALGQANRITAEGVAAILGDIGGIVGFPNDPLRPCLPPNPI